MGQLDSTLTDRPSVHSILPECDAGAQFMLNLMRRLGRSGRAMIWVRRPI
jgi:hypothetical protein